MARGFLGLVLVLVFLSGWTDMAQAGWTMTAAPGTDFGADYAGAAAASLLAIYGVTPTSYSGMIYNSSGEPTQFGACNADGSHPSTWCAYAVNLCSLAFRNVVWGCAPPIVPAYQGPRKCPCNDGFGLNSAGDPVNILSGNL